jgi:hypothetical protein
MTSKEALLEAILREVEKSNQLSMQLYQYRPQERQIPRMRVRNLSGNVSVRDNDDSLLPNINEGTIPRGLDLQKQRVQSNLESLSQWVERLRKEAYRLNIDNSSFVRDTLVNESFSNSTKFDSKVVIFSR